jgi:DNA-binding beta-propeller fold protein YncE
MINRREAGQALALVGLQALISPTRLPAAGALNKPAAPSALIPYRVVHGWPTLPEGVELGQVSGVGVDSQERVFVFHRADHSLKRTTDPIKVPAVLCFDGQTGKFLASWGENMFVLPHGLRVDQRDNVWLTDCTLHQVFKFSNKGKLLMSVGTARTPGCDGTHFNQPTDVAITKDGTFYVSDGYGNSRIAKFSPEGRFLLDWGRAGENPGEFRTPHNVLAGPDGRIYVADRGNARVQIFAQDGKYISEWKGSALGRPWGLANGPDGFIYMVDGGDNPAGPANRGRIVRLDLSGNVLEKWGTSGRYDGQLYLGHDIAVGKSGDVYVGDVSLGMRVQKFSRSRQDCTCMPS